MDLKCEYDYIKIMDGRKFYICKIINQSIPNRELNFSGTHMDERSNKDVQAVLFDDCSIDHIPKGLTKCFPFIEDLSIWKSAIKKISYNDLVEYKNLKMLYITESRIEFLPGDLFKDFHNIEEISFENNKLKFIEPNIMNGLNNLKYVSFHYNPNYTKCYSLYPEHMPNATLEELKYELYQVFNFHKDMVLKQLDIDELMEKTTVETQTYIVNNPKHHEPENGISYYLKKHIKDDRFKDFKINIDDREFHVHKFVLSARSPTLAEVLLNNPEVENLNLIDIPVDIFEMILNYMYNDELPKTEGLDVLRLYAAAGRLKIEELMDFAAGKLIDKINDQNAIEVFKLSYKYEHAELKQKAFDKIKAEYPKIKFQDSCADNPDLVEKLIEKFEQKEKAVRMLAEEFENKLMMNNN